MVKRYYELGRKDPNDYSEVVARMPHPHSSSVYIEKQIHTETRMLRLGYGLIQRFFHRRFGELVMVQPSVELPADERGTTRREKTPEELEEEAFRAELVEIANEEVGDDERAKLLRQMMDRHVEAAVTSSN